MTAREPLPLRPRSEALGALARYWPRDATPVGGLPFVRAERPSGPASPPEMTMVALPEWSAHWGIDGSLLVPRHCIASGSGPNWRCTDWPAAIRWYLDGAAERAHEREHDPIHSYSVRLRGWDERIWQRAWVNRMALFLRQWAAHVHGRDADALLGPLPEARLHLTHDVDAVRKTMAIRAKQSAFQLFNCARAIRRGDPGRALNRLMAVGRFLLRASDYDRLGQVATLEERHGVRSRFLVHGGRGGWLRRPSQMLFDPSYSLYDPGLAAKLLGLRAGGWSVGLHQSFGAWSSAAPMAHEKKRLERCLGVCVAACRQHWLRFGWSATWAAQERAGLSLDFTLGFNDRPGFRNGAALRHKPWDAANGRALDLESVPLVLMDSHLFDYQMLDPHQRREHIAAWLDEVRAVRGEASVLWHPHAFSPDFHWGPEYEYVLARYADIAAPADA